jgi:glycosyltransferase involved in cell wall biosynthesis
MNGQGLMAEVMARARRISFVIPAYNEERYIGDCLASVLAELQGKPYDAEIIVVNNGSTDNTKAIAKSFRNVVVTDEPTKGLARARQAGFVVATGELVANVDADTRLPPGWIDRVMVEFQRNSELVALSGPFVYTDLSVVGNALVHMFYRMALAWHIVVHRILKTGAVLQGGNFVLRRSALEQIGGYDTRFAFYGEDTDVARRIRERGDVKFTLTLGMNASGRRLKAAGLLRMGLRYAVNHLWTIFFRKPFTPTSIDFR